MAQSNTLIEPGTAAATGLNPTPSFLMSVVVTILAPIFQGVTGGDTELARMAAAETVNDFRARNNMDLFAIMQIITNGFAAGDSLCRSMGNDVSLSMALRLRGNAIGLNRASEQNRRVLREKPIADPAMFYPASVPDLEPPILVAETDSPTEQGGQPEHDWVEVPGLLMNDMAIQLLAAEAEARLLQPVEQACDPMPAKHVASVTTKPLGSTSFRRMRARAILLEAGDLTDSLHTLAPAERRDAEVRIAALGSRVRELLTGTAPVEAMADLDRDDTVAIDPGFSAVPEAGWSRPLPH